MTSTHRTRLRPHSAASARAQRQRVDRLRRTTHGPVRCQWPDGCAAEGVDAHESLSRARGGDPLDPDWVLCRSHHDAITSASGELLIWAVERGLIRPTPRERFDNVNETVTVTGMERRPIAARISPAADHLVDGYADRHKASRALVFRAMLSVAAAHPDEIDAKIKQLQEV